MRKQNTRAKTPKELAQRAASLTLCDECDSRAFDTCFESGNGTLVVCEFIRLHDADFKLQRAVQRNNRYINIDAWIETARKAEPQLFETKKETS